ncbi:MAG: PAS domain-containing protein [Crenarchaeota archaeon]|nr:PAS domain-containing protein [Thermoproteota archaeon]
MNTSTQNFKAKNTSIKKQVHSKNNSNYPKQSSNEGKNLLAIAEQVAHFGSWEWDVSKPCAIWSPEMFRIFGIEPREEGLTLEEYKSFIYPDDLPEINKRIGESFTKARIDQKGVMDYRIIRSDGSIRVIHSQRQVKELTQDGSLKVVVGVDQDVTEQRQAEEYLKKSEERFRIVAEAANVMVYEYNFSAQKIQFIHGAEQLSGYSMKEIGPTLDWILDHTHPEDVQKLKKIWKKVVLNPKLSRYVLEYRFRHKNGNYITLKDTAKVIKDPSGKVISVIGGARDITQRKFDKEKLTRYNKHLEELVEERTKQLIDYERLAAIGQTTGMVGHDIRNPLQALTAEVFLIKSELDNIQEIKVKQNIIECIENIDENINYINKIVADLQDYSRKLKPEPMEVNLVALITDIFSTVKIPGIIQLSFNIKPVSKVTADPTFIRRALTNLINNAVQAMPNGGKLEITSYHEHNNVCITVADTGVGIAEDVKHKLFSPMFTTKAKGQGLGLSVVKRLIEVQGGSVCFDSQLGRGTKFIIKLPL